MYMCTPCAIDYSRGFWYSTLPCPFTFEGAKLLAASISATQWCKSHAHISFQSQVIFYICQLNVKEYNERGNVMQYE